MNSTKHILVVLVFLLLCAPLVAAQESQPTSISRDPLSRELTIIVQQHQLRFAAPASTEFANKHRIPVEQVKPERERGYYLRPQVFNQPEEKSLNWARNPEMMRQARSQRPEQ